MVGVAALAVKRGVKGEECKTNYGSSRVCFSRLFAWMGNGAGGAESRVVGALAKT
jgi:hypothetical protein